MTIENCRPQLRKWMAICFGWLCFLFLAGCGKDVAQMASDSDANGYLCRKCGEKFFTDRKVFADFCPKCKSYDLAEVIGFVCAKDGHLTVTVRGPQSANCAKCQTPVSTLRLPRRTELKAWGAPERARAEVSGP